MRLWRDGSRALTVLAVCVPLWLAAGAAATAADDDVTVVAIGTSRTDRQVSMVVDVRGARPEPDSFSLTVSGARQQVRPVPVFSDQLALGLVVDASEDGRAALQAGLAGAANFALEHPAAGATVVADTSPPTIATVPAAKPTDVVQALSAIRPAGQRDTSAALSMVVRELAAVQATSRLVLLYTSAPDAGGEPAADLVARLVDAHVVLSVVSPTADAGYWHEVTRRTGGVLATTDESGAFVAFDQVADALRSRYLVSFPAPDRLPGRVSLRLQTPQGTAAAAAVVPDPSGPNAAEPAGSDDSAGSAVADPRSALQWLPLLTAAALFAAGCIALLVLARRAQTPAPAGPSSAGPSSAGPSPAGASPARAVDTRPGDHDRWFAFPPDWTDERITRETADISTDPSLTWTQITGQEGASVTRDGAPVRYSVTGVRGGVKIRVIVEPNGAGIIDSYRLVSATEVDWAAAALRNVIMDCEGSLPARDVATVSGFVDDGELELAFETLCTQLHEFDITLGRDTLAQLTSLGKYLHLDPRLCQALAGQKR